MLLPDLQGLPAAYGYSWEWLMWLDRETLAYALLGVACVWIFYIDVRPLFRRWLDGLKTEPIGICYENAINDPARCGPNKFASLLVPSSGDKSAPLQELAFRIGVRNGLSDQSLRNVHVVIETITKPLAFCDIKLPVSGDEGKHYADIAPGRVVYFDLGTTIQKGIIGVDDFRSINPLAFELLRTKSSAYGFSIPAGGGRFMPLLRNDGYKATIGVYADDRKPVFATFTINAKDQITVHYDGINPSKEKCS